MTKTFMAMAAAALTICANAQNATGGKSTPPPPPAARQLSPSQMDLATGTAESTVKIYKERLVKYKPEEKPQPRKDEKDDAANKDDLQPIDIQAMSGKMKLIAQSLNVEEDSGYDRRWFAELQVILEKLTSVRTDMEMAVINKREEEYSQYLAYFKKGVAKYAEVSAKPVKLDKEQLEKVRVQNAKIRKKLLDEQKNMTGKS